MKLHVKAATGAALSAFLMIATPAFAQSWSYSPEHKRAHVFSQDGKTSFAISCIRGEFLHIEVNFNAGSRGWRSSGNVHLNVDGKAFTVYGVDGASDHVALLTLPNDQYGVDGGLLSALQSGSAFSLGGTQPAQMPVASRSYSLRGSSAALSRVRTACQPVVQQAVRVSTYKLTFNPLPSGALATAVKNAWEKDPKYAQHVSITDMVPDFAMAQFDLNGDGRPDVFAQHDDDMAGFCFTPEIGRDKCLMVVYLNTGRGLVKVGEIPVGAEVLVSTQTANGLRDIIIPQGNKRSKTYRFNGKAYVAQ